MARLPVISGHELVKLLSKICYKPVSIRGSHCKLRRIKPLIVPLHPEISRGTLSAILNEIELNENIPRETLKRLLRGESIEIPCPLKH